MRWVLPVVLVAMIITVAGGLVAREIYVQPVASAPAAVTPDPQPLPPGEQPGDATVQGLRDATEHPLYETVKTLLQTYFDAINGKRYDRWQAVVSLKRAKSQPEQDWLAAYRTTKDGSIVILRIESGPAESAKVLLTFTSVQDPRSAPLEMPERCIKWRVVFPLAVEDGEWKLDAGPTSSAPQHDKC
jgi:hypothetical protein